jgi:hypothetical protein
MKTFLLAMVIGMMPLFVFSQDLLTDVTISPDSLFFDNQYKQSTTLSNNTNQPINITSVQRNCIGCIGWTWKVDSMSFNTPHFIYPGQTESITIQVYGSVLNSSPTGYLQSTMEIASSVGAQYCHIFINQALLTAIDDKTEKNIKLYPNPARSMVFVSLPVASTDPRGSLTMYDLRGQLVLTKVLVNENTGIDVSGLKPGVYFVRFSDNRMTRVLKFIKN